MTKEFQRKDPGTPSGLPCSHFTSETPHAFAANIVRSVYKKHNLYKEYCKRKYNIYYIFILLVLRLGCQKYLIKTGYDWMTEVVKSKMK